MGLADRRVLREATSGLAIAEHGQIAAALATLATTATDALIAQGVAADAIRVEQRVHLRRGQTDYGIEVDLAGPDAMIATFDTAHRAQFGFVSAAPLIADRIIAEAIAASPRPETAPLAFPSEPAPPLATAPVYLAGAWHETPVWAREGLPMGHSIAGPALIIDSTATTVVEPGWRARVDNIGNLILDRTTQPNPNAVGTPITGRPPHRTVQAAFPHTAPTLGV
jgi:5-oxoprolinase (ATP-hydrolysing)